jgi:hypothetical protein
MLALLFVFAQPYIPLMALVVLGLWLLQWRASRRPGRTNAWLQFLVCFTAIEELLVAPAWWIELCRSYGSYVLPSKKTFFWGALVPLSSSPGLLLALYGVGSIALLLSWRRIPLPEWLFPMRGRWLRRLLAGAALISLLAAGPWWFVVYKLAVEAAGGTMRPYVPLLVAVDIALYLWTVWVWLDGSSSRGIECRSGSAETQAARPTGSYAA